MKILFFGDVIGSAGRYALAEVIPKWRKKYDLDLVLANGENLAHGKGVTRTTLNEILEAGVDLVTSGNDVWRNKEVQELLNNQDIPLIRPANYPAQVPGQGWRLIKLRTKKILVLNLIGRVFMHQQCDDPFRKADMILEENEGLADMVIVDMHAEASSEKKALAWYLDGRVTAVLGTHTHVPTADQRLLPQGTAYITDIGMVGPYDSVIGADKDIVLKRFLTQVPQHLELAKGLIEINAVLLEIDNKNKAKKIERLREIIGENT